MHSDSDYMTIMTIFIIHDYIMIVDSESKTIHDIMLVSDGHNIMGLQS